MAEALRIAIVGAESTGKSTLAAALAAALAQPGGPRVAWVPELLREWCSRVGRTPQAHEQPGILRAQHASPVAIDIAQSLQRLGDDRVPVARLLRKIRWRRFAIKAARTLYLEPILEPGDPHLGSMERCSNSARL